MCGMREVGKCCEGNEKSVENVEWPGYMVGLRWMHAWIMYVSLACNKRPIQTSN